MRMTMTVRMTMRMTMKMKMKIENLKKIKKLKMLTFKN